MRLFAPPALLIVMLHCWIIKMRSRALLPTSGRWEAVLFRSCSQVNSQQMFMVEWLAATCLLHYCNFRVMHTSFCIKLLFIASLTELNEIQFQRTNWNWKSCSTWTPAIFNPHLFPSCKNSETSRDTSCIETRLPSLTVYIFVFSLLGFHGQPHRPATDSYIPPDTLPPSFIVRSHQTRSDCRKRKCHVPRSLQDLN